MTQLSARRRAATSAVRPAQGWTPPPLDTAPRGRRLLAALSLSALIAGVPVGLAAVIGWPLPGSLPDLGELRTVLSSPLAPSLVIDILALVAWAAWAHFAVCVLVELTAAARARSSGRVGEAVRVPGGRWSQELARRLVETAFASAIATSVGLATFSGTILTPARPAVAAVQALPAESAAQHAVLLHAEEPATGPATAQVGRPRAAVPRPEYVVQAPDGGYYDSLWDIADRFLGDGQRWREIYELNESREQPDGRALSRPDLIRPGWRLQLPYDATGVRPETSPDLTQPAPSTSENGAGLPADVASAPAQPGCAQIPLQAPAPGPSPASALEADRSGAEAQLPFTPADPTPAPTAGEDDQVPHGDEDEEARSPGAVVPLSGLLAAAALAALATRRHRQRRRRAAGQSITTPGPGAARAEVDLRVLAEPADLTLVDEALRAISVSLRDRDDHRPPDVRSASLRNGNLELGLGDPDPDAPPPFLADSDGLMWCAAAHARPLVSQEQATEALPLFPLLLTVGRDAEGLVLLDLEAVGSLAVEGPAADVRDVLCHVVAEAALAPWAEDVEIVLLGFEKEAADVLESLAADRITSVDEVDAALLRVLAKRADGVAAAGDRLATRLRRGVHDEVRPPLLLVCAAPPSPPSSEQLASLLPAAGRGAVTVVAPGPWSAARATWRLGEPLPSLGAEPAPAPCRLDAERLNHLAELLRVAREVPDSLDQQAVAEPVSAAAENETRLRAARLQEVRVTGPAAVAVPAPRVIEREEQPDLVHRDELDVALDAYFANTAPASVALLGPISVHATGSVDPDRRSRLTEIVAYLATHRRGVPVADFDTAIWPERQVTLKTRNQAITRARAWLGSDEDGVSWLRPMCDGALRLSTQVLVDWELFQALQQRAREPGRSTADVRRDLETAMRLVRGRPLSPLPTGRYGWLAETYLEQEIPSAIIDVAHALAGLLLQAGDATGAMEVARRALEVDRYDERPWRDLLEAHHLRGEGRQVALLVDQLLELLEVEVDDELQPETAELIERLLPQRRRA
jgi:DNA-binding SARP family transcriptional activator